MATAQNQLIRSPQPYRWTRAEYYRLGQAGIFNEQRVELIEGEVIAMSPIYSPHATSVTLATEVLRECFGKGWVVRVQSPLSLGERSEPEPDIAVVAGKIRDFKDAHPTAAALVVEVSDSTLVYDRNRKASLYAKAGIGDYWIINLEKRQVEVRRRPIVDATAKYGFAYAEKFIFSEDEHVSPLVKPEAAIAVADLLP